MNDCTCGDCHVEPDEFDLIVADAVIEALGLEQEDGECGYCHAQLPGCRYVTEWEITDRQPRSAEKLGLTGNGE